MDIRGITLSKATVAYLAAAIWSSLNDNGDPLDDDYDIHDIGDVSLRDAQAVVESFSAANADTIRLSDMDDGQLGHDLWLTRNRHGAGFWCRGYPKHIGETLTRAAEALGECYIVANDDGTLGIVP